MAGGKLDCDCIYSYMVLMAAYPSDIFTNSTLDIVVMFTLSPLLLLLILPKVVYFLLKLPISYQKIGHHKCKIIFIKLPISCQKIGNHKCKIIIIRGVTESLGRRIEARLLPAFRLQ